MTWATIAVRNRIYERTPNFRGALCSGVIREELEATIMQAAMCCGVPVDRECHREAHRVLEAPERAA